MWCGRSELGAWLKAIVLVYMLDLCLMFIFSTQFFLFIRDDSKATPLHEAAANGHEKVVDLLLSDSYKAHINAENMWRVCRLNLLQLICGYFF